MGLLGGRLSSGLWKCSRQDWLIPRHVMFKAGDPRVEVMPKAFAIPRLTGELVAALLRVNDAPSGFLVLAGNIVVSVSSLAHQEIHGVAITSRSNLYPNRDIISC